MKTKDISAQFVKCFSFYGQIVITVLDMHVLIFSEPSTAGIIRMQLLFEG